MATGTHDHLVSRRRLGAAGSRRPLVVWTFFFGLSALWLSACHQSPINARDPRSQYSRYDLVRGQYPPQYLEDEFGRRIPNLRGRLLAAE
ncbi:MAG: hypothetical protein DYG93_02665 [Leptolyngbya sp. PLA2]|nr:hypothetical protein [Leptolyngbya sp. PL-A2]MCQ3940447.1 hypothetical protein [cyanobacterium CYA1]MCZ7633911.1 hypothetical protein [Phycisphaerales bacterium]MDL1904296.1 hypothetical protein [Synechococcales cyanobacterium CNB]GIK19527.1 MAG: hypothetical protein BroJett004_16910 [Planctomycetota bacterium]